ncbi:large ribosomal subunit protein mL65-like [Lineus longissimus]|uniref:large ribosomal subunit protein mL65-like n=1 Tax=Lineus longissimus TaxID=88925 RepID=UPI00315D67CC
MLCRFPKRFPFKFYRFSPPKNNNFRCSSTLTNQGQSEYSLEPEYPPVTPRWPPGKWGEMKEKIAWEFYEETVKLQDTEVLHEKLDALRNHEKIYSIVKPDDSTPRILDFQQNVTKTAIVEGLPPMYENIVVDEEFEILKPLILDGLVRDYRAQFVKDIHGKKAHLQEPKYSKRLVHSLTDMLLATLAGSHDHLLRSQIDRDGRIECFWSKLLEKDLCPDNPSQQHPGLGKHRHLRLQLNHVSDLMMRTEQPLPEFLPRDDVLCTSADVPDYDYHPRAANAAFARIKPSVVAGYKTKDQFVDGAPCEFGHVSFHTCNEVAHNRERLKQNIDREFVRSLGVLTSFGWTAAQAYNQGFDWLNDVTYPFTTQTVVTDGKNITFFAYQLNTLLLWKSNDVNPLRNIMWTSPEMQLYEAIEGDQVIGFNDEALKTLIKIFKNAPVDRGVDLRPYLSKDYEPLKAVPYMNIKGEPVIERPHPPRLFAESKKKPLAISPIVTTQEKIQKMWEKGNRHWNEEKQRFDIVERK